MIVSRVPWAGLPKDTASLVSGARRASWVAGPGGVMMPQVRYRVSQAGLGAFFDGSQAFGSADATENPVAGLTSATFLAVATPFGLPSGSNEEQIIGRWGSAAGFVYQYSWGILWRGSTVGFYAGDGGSSNLDTGFAASYTVQVGRPLTVVVRYNGLLSGAAKFTFYINGVKYSATSWFTQGSFSALGTSPLIKTTMGYVGQNGSTTDARLSNTLVHAWSAIGQDIGDALALQVSSNPGTLFEARRIWVPVTAGSITVYRPNSDVAVSGWTPSTGPTIAGVLDEAIVDDADYAISPLLNSPTPATMGLSASVPAGTYTVRVRGLRTEDVGQLRIHLLDGSNVSQGSSSWQALTGSYATYSLTVTTTGTATRIQIEVAP